MFNSLGIFFSIIFWYKNLIYMVSKNLITTPRTLEEGLLKVPEATRENRRAAAPLHHRVDQEGIPQPERKEEQVRAQPLNPNAPVERPGHGNEGQPHPAVPRKRCGVVH